MGLRIKKGRNGKPRETWYARFTRNGEKVDVNLRVPIRGIVPVDASGKFDADGAGDAAFAKSRAAALAALEKMQAEVRTTGDTKAVKDAKTADIQKQYYRARTGKSIRGVRLVDLPKKWMDQKRSYTPTENWKSAVSNWFARFAKFAAHYAAKRGNRCDTVNEITPEIATAWFEEIKSAFTWETVTKQMSLMRNAFARYSTNGEQNPFADIIMRNRETANARKPHKPLVGAELERLFDCAREDAAVYPLIVTAACTGMRCGDVCNLKWADVDLLGGFIDCVTAKAGVRVSIPIFGRLREVLTERAALSADGAEPSAFVFPLAAAQYNPHPKIGKNGKPEIGKDGKPQMTDGKCDIYKAAKPYFARAVFGDAPDMKPTNVDADGNVIAPPSLNDVIDGARFAEAKHTRLLEVNRRFRAGEQSNMIATALGVSRSQVSFDLREIEKLTGENLRPRAAAKARRKTKIDLIEQTREKRDIGRRAASIYGYHSLRATFVVLAVEAGVPLADIARVVGHTTTDTTMQYFNPERKHAAERVRNQMRGSVLDGDAPAERIAIAAGAKTSKPTAALAPAKDRAAAVRALTLARAVIGTDDQAATVAAVIQAAGVDADKAPERALALIAATVDADTKARIAAVIKAAGVTA